MSLRSKLLALYLILMLVTEFPEVFTTAKVYFLTDGHGPQPVREATFLTAIKPYFGLCLTRNLLATLPKIYELALATFEGVVETMRWSLKREVEVYLKEILIPNLESKPQGCQKHVLITMFLSKLCADPHMLVEFYLFYDCNRGSLNNNIFEHLTRALSKLATSIQTSQESPPVWEDADAFQAGAKLLNRGDLLNLPTLTSDRFTSGYIARSFFSRVTFTDPILQYRAMECLVAILKSLVKWSHRTPFTDVATPAHPGGEADSPVDPNFTPLDQGPTEGLTLQEGVDLFNRKPRKGIERLIKHGLIPSHQPHDVAQFLLTTPELSKVALGEFLGEADARNVEIMHALVDLLDFSGLELVPALRRLLQAFRLPGEALKADRLLLKFAERYTAQNPKAFASADAAYVLSYSAILLDADLHHPQLKRHTTLQEFINTTCGTDGGADFSEELLAGIYQHIASLAINLRDEAEVDIARPTLSNAELPRGCSLRRKSAYSASHVEHARSMFEACWMASLAAISELLKSRDESRMVALCLDGFRSAIHLASFFDLDLARNALMTAISNFCFPSNLREMGPRDLEVIRTMLDVAIEDGNYLRGSWADVLQIVNHLVRIQVIPNFTASTNGQDRSLVAHRDPHTLAEPTSQAMLIAVDKVFAYSVRLSGPAIVEFIRALSQIAVDELADLPSGFDCTRVPTSPKMFAIQKVVEVAYCNMNRIRLEWGEIWAVLGPTFGTLGCHANEAVGSFVVDSLRQLATKFLDLEELAHFQFQRQMLSPFVRIVGGSPTVAIQDTALQCLQHLVRTSAPHLKSGWKAISQALGAADRDAALVTRAFEMAKDLGNDHFEWVAANFDNFKAFLDCLAKFAKNPHFPKISLHAVEVYHFVTTRMVDFAASRGPPSEPSGSEFWVPVFEGQMEMVLEVKDLEVRTRAMDHMFAHLHRHGHGFAEPLWHHLLSQVLFPLFSTVGQPAKDKVAGLSYPDAYPDEAAVWVSTTLVHALRKFVRLFTEFFDKVFQFLDGLLDLLSVCLCQEDPALCRVGADCLRALIEDNIDRMSEDDWQRIVSIVIRLFRATSQVSQDPEVGLTLPTRANPSLERFEASSPLPLVPSSPAQQLSLCLSVIALVEEVFLQNDRVFLRLGPEHIFLILDVVERAYLETQRTNATFDLAGAIERQSVSKLDRFANTALSLELACLVCLVKVLLKMYVSSDAAFEPYASQIHRRLVPLCRDSFKQFNALSEHPLTPGVQTIHRRWHQAVLRVGNFLSTATGPQFREIFGPLSGEAIRTLRHRHLSHEVQVMMYNLMERVDAIYIHPSR
ncbi:guanine nucleotide exchange protein for ADP-robosylation factor [Massospora cicadina]|nr:guanine nucleotide exchange protein for ADP-robosylation factor [Massospora cicadina]